VALASLPVATAEGRGFGFGADTLGLDQPHGKLYVAGGGNWPNSSALVMEYDVAADTWDPYFPNLNAARRDHAGAYAPLCTPDEGDGLPGMWVFGGRVSTEDDEPPYGATEYFSFPCEAPASPQAAFTAVPVDGTMVLTRSVLGCAPLTVQFTDVSSGTVLERGWAFGDQAGASTNWRPAHVYEAAGSFTVTLSVTNTSGSDSITGTVVVSATPQAAFTYTPTEIFTDTLVQFHDVSTGTVQEWRWEFGDGHESPDQNPVHTFLEPGKVTVSLAVVGDTGCANAVSQELLVRGSSYFYYFPEVRYWK
jgi:chitodextrinase